MRFYNQDLGKGTGRRFLKLNPNEFDQISSFVSIYNVRTVYNHSNRWWTFITEAGHEYDAFTGDYISFAPYGKGWRVCPASMGLVARLNREGKITRCL